MSEQASTAATPAVSAAPAIVAAAPAAPAAPATAESTGPGNLLAETKAGEGVASPEAAATTEAAKVEEKKPEAAVVPEKYDFKVPEGTEMDEGLSSAYQEFAKGAKLTQEQFDALTPKLAEKLTEIRGEAFKAYSDLQNKWIGEVKADPEFGGAKLESSLADAAKAIDSFGGPALRDALRVTGAGNNPAIVKAFIQIGKLISDESRFVSGKPATQPVSGAERMFPRNAAKG